MKKEVKWSVYMHFFPNGKRYIGITCQKIDYRFNKGRGYMSQKLVFAAIHKYVWDNVITDTIHEGLSKEDAKQVEINLIAEYKTTDPAFGYNLTIGGEGSNGYHPTEETLQKMRMAQIGKKKSAEFCENSRQRMLGNSLSEETKQKLREINRLRGTPKISPEGLERIKEAGRRRKGMKGKPQTPESNLARSQKLMGIKRSEETKQKMSKAKSRVDPGRIGGQ